MGEELSGYAEATNTMMLVKEAPEFLETESELDSELASIERRRGLRVAQARPIKIFEPTAARYYGGQTHDVSTTGLRVELPVSTPIRPGKLLSVHVGPNENGIGLANRRQMIPARVVWVDRSPMGRGRMTAGVEFLSSVAAHLDAA